MGRRPMKFRTKVFQVEGMNATGLETPETRARRIKKSVAMVQAGKK